MSDRCNQDVYDNGIQVFMTHTIRAKNVEIWVQKIAKESGQKVDWSYAAGRAFVLAIGDIDKVREAIKKNREMHDDLYFYAVKELGDMFTDEMIVRQLEGIWNYNGLT